MLTSRSLLAAGLMTLVLASPVMAAKKTNADAKQGKATPAAAAVDAVATAHRLVRYGDARKDALSLITAAQMLKQAGSTAAEFKRAEGKAGEAKDKPELLSVDAILARAKTYASGNPALVALAEDVAKDGARGASGGPKTSRSVVNGHSRDVYTLRFEGGEPARVFVSGDGDSDLDLYVYDENGNEICKDVDSTDDMICTWRPRWTGEFRIVIKNLGVANLYRIWTN